MLNQICPVCNHRHDRAHAPILYNYVGDELPLEPDVDHIEIYSCACPSCLAFWYEHQVFQLGDITLSLAELYPGGLWLDILSDNYDPQKGG